MKNKLSRIFVIMIVMGLMILSTTNVQAALQANGNSSKTDTLMNWFVNIRNMESTGGTLGLTDTINNSTLSSTATKSNNLDIHMEKNTEYGAMVILSASSYGNQNVIKDGDTTTGNKTGVVMKINKEWVAAGGLSRNSEYKNINAKYKNIFTNDKYVYRAGDALTETKDWHGSNMSIIDINLQSCGLLRAYSGSIFSYCSGGDGNSTECKNTKPDKLWSSRAVIVVGNGF